MVHALIFTAVHSRHMFVWLTFTQTLEAVVAGCEAAWAFFGGVFRVLIPIRYPAQSSSLVCHGGNRARENHRSHGAHANVGTTLAVYVYLFPDDATEDMAALGALAATPKFHGDKLIPLHG